MGGRIPKCPRSSTKRPSMNPRQRRDRDAEADFIAKHYNRPEENDNGLSDNHSGFDLGSDQGVGGRPEHDTEDDMCGRERKNQSPNRGRNTATLSNKRSTKSKNRRV